VSLNAGQETLDPVAEDPAAGSASPAVAPIAGVPAWMHFAAVWSIAVIAMVAIVVFYGLGIAVPGPLLTIGGAAIGGALGITLPALRA
jgi:hypothetical protein